MSTIKKKGGAVGQVEREFILKNMNKMTVEELAEHFNRDPKVIEKIIRTHIELPQANNQTARFHLRKSSYWKQLKDVFSEQELNMIEEEYCKYIEQFRQDIVATEEVQILDLVKIGILQQRNLEGKRRLVDNMQRYQGQVDDLMRSVGDDYSRLTLEQQNNVMEINKNIQACLNAESARTAEYNELQKQKNTLFDKLMGSRDQRVKEILNTKITFSGLIKQLLDRDKQLESSRFLELGKLASEKEFNRLMQPHKFLDEQIDNPILCAEVLDKLDKQEQQQIKEEKNESTESKGNNV